jgi:hypothetical protein
MLENNIEYEKFNKIIYNLSIFVINKFDTDSRSRLVANDYLRNIIGNYNINSEWNVEFKEYYQLITSLKIIDKYKNHINGKFNLDDAEIIVVSINNIKAFVLCEKNNSKGNKNSDINKLKIIHNDENNNNRNYLVPINNNNKTELFLSSLFSIFFAIINNKTSINILNDNKKIFFEENGYLIFENFYDDNSLKEISNYSSLLSSSSI